MDQLYVLVTLMKLDHLNTVLLDHLTSRKVAALLYSPHYIRVPFPRLCSSVHIVNINDLHAKSTQRWYERGLII
jgi:hypothetical protein